MSPARAALLDELECERLAPPPPPLDDVELEWRRRRAELVRELARRPRPPR